jgi:phage RecT family recombinase
MNAIAPAKKQEQELIIKTPMQLQQYMMGLIENEKFAQRYEGIIDRKSMFMAVQSMNAIWWQISNIEDFDFGSVVTETIKAACYGWTLDGITGHAYLVPYGKQVRLQPGYKGLIDLVHRSDQCEPSMEAVYEGDVYEYLGRFKEPKHIRSGDQLRRSKPVTHVYVVAAFRSGIIKCFSWTVQECIAHRDRFSKGWAGVRNKPEKAKNHPWCETHPGFWVMCAKCVLTNAVNRGELPVSMKDLRGKEQLSLGEDDDMTVDGTAALVAATPPLPKIKQDEPLTFDSPAGYSETLHDPGDEIAADAAPHLAEQTPVDPKAVYLRQLAACKTVAEVDQCVSDAMNDPEGADIRREGEDKKSAMTFLERERTSTRKR